MGSLYTSSAGSNNYTSAADNTNTLTIGKANAVINITPYSVTYNGDAHTAAATATGVEATPSDLSSLFTLAGTTHTNAGDYTGDAWNFACY